MTRKPASDRYDAIIDLFPPQTLHNFAYALVKFSYVADGGRLLPAPPDPLLHDLRDPMLDPRLPQGSDFWHTKDATDVVVLGSAFARAGYPVVEKRVNVQVGNSGKRVQVWGQRYAIWKQGKPVFTAPEPFEEMPIVNENAYGGCDPRVPVEPPRELVDELVQQFDHPGLYPRNPFGKGYVVSAEPVDGVRLPNLEDPADPLTPERFLVRDPRNWWQQPLPWSLDWHHPLMFPRYVWAGSDAWFPGPDDAQLQEVARGFLPSRYRSVLIDGFDPTLRPPSQFYREASLGMSFPDLAPGTPIAVVGMHPEGRTVELIVPPPPQLEIVVEGDVQRVKPLLTNLVIEPALQKVTMTYCGRRDQMPRHFIPGIHGAIPLALRVDRGAAIAYEAPPTVKSQFDAATAKGPNP